MRVLLLLFLIYCYYVGTETEDTGGEQGASTSQHSYETENASPEEEYVEYEEEEGEEGSSFSLFNIYGYETVAVNDEDAFKNYRTDIIINISIFDVYSKSAHSNSKSIWGSGSSTSWNRGALMEEYEAVLDSLQSIYKLSPAAGFGENHAIAMEGIEELYDLYYIIYKILQWEANDAKVAPLEYTKTKLTILAKATTLRSQLNSYRNHLLKYEF